MTQYNARPPFVQELAKLLRLAYPDIVAHIIIGPVRRGRDRASPKKSSLKTVSNRKTLYRTSQKYSFLTPDWSAP
jgi:hypothetical protein